MTGRLLRRLVFIALGILLAVPLLLAALLVASIESKPGVSRPVVLAPENIERAKRIVDAHRYRVRPGMLATLRVRQDDADLAANYFVHRYTKGSAEVTLTDKRARLRASIPVPGQILPGYFNVDVTAVETASVPSFESLRLGPFPIPDVVTAAAAPMIVAALRGSPEFRAIADSLQSVRISAQTLTAVYRWTGGFHQEIQAAVLSDEDRVRIRHYQSMLVPLAAAAPPEGMRLSALLRSLASEARARSAAGDPVAENRAWLLAATFLVLGKPLKLVIPEAKSWPRAPRVRVALDGRDDFAKHFMVSATIAAYADTALADAVGLYKEIEDSRTGSGFSFNDIAADRAGTKFGEKAVASAGSASKLQAETGTGPADRDLMPKWSDLPEFMPEAEFKARFGGVDAPAYRQMMEEIEGRVAALPLLR